MIKKEEYEIERNSIDEEYFKKGRRALRGIVGSIIPFALGISSLVVETYKLKALKENSAISKEYENDIKAISYFKEELGEHETKKLNLDYLSKGLKEELYNVYDAHGSRIVPGLEKTIEIIQKDISRISNSQEFKEYTKKADKINDIYGKGGIGLFGLGLILLFGSNLLQRSYEKDRERKIRALNLKHLLND